MAIVINNLIDGIEIVQDSGTTTFIKYQNCKLILKDAVTIYDNSRKRLGTEKIVLTFSEVTSPLETSNADLYATIKTYID